MSDHTYAPVDQPADAMGRLRSVTRPMNAAAPRQDRADDWDAASAEALMQVYEGHEPTVYYADPPPAPQARRATPALGIVGTPPAAYVAGPMGRAAAMPASAVALADLAQDRAWLDGRFSDLAARLEDTMKRLDPAEQIAPLAQRLDGLEGHLRSALEDVVRQDAFAGLEEQIGDVRQQLETARDKLERLDGIEAKLGALTSFAEAAHDAQSAGLQSPPAYDIEAILSEAVDRTATRMARQAPAVAPSLNMDELADRTASRTAERMAAAPLRTAVPEGMGELRALVSGYVEEYRREQSQTSAALATMQEALVQLIDRIDQYDEDAHAAEAEQPEHAAPSLVAEPADRFVEVAEERSGRPGRRANDGRSSDFGPAIQEPNLDPVVTPARPEARAARAPTASALEDNPAQAALRTPRRGPATVVAPEPDSNTVTAAEAMAAERARVSAERATLAATRRPGARSTEARSNEARSPEARIPEGRGSEAVMPGPDPTAADGAAHAQADATATKPRGTRAPAAGSSSVARRGLMVAGIAALVIGVSAFAHMFISSRMTAMPKMEDRVPSAAASSSSGPKLTPRPQANPGTPPSALTGAPVPANPDAPRIQLTPPANPASIQSAPPRIPQQPAPQQQPGPQSQPQPSSNVMPDAFKPRSVPDTVNDDLQSNARPGGARPSPAAMTGIALDNGNMPDPSELAKRLAPPTASPSNIPTASPSAKALPISTGPTSTGPTSTGPTSIGPTSIGTQPEPAQQTEIVNPRTPVEMPPATVGPSSLRVAAQQGDPAAQFEVAARFAEGKGMKQDFQQAITWYTRAAQKGFVPAQYRLATLYERGLGTSADITRAKVWYRRAADQGNVKSMHNLAVLAAGPQQAEPDYPTASRWFTEAAERGLADSQFNLGVLTENGLGMTKDQIQAYKWFALAARSGDKEAARRRDQLAATFTPEQARSAEALVTGWRSKPMEMKANDPRAAGLAMAAEREAAALAAQQKQAEQQPQQQVAPMPPPPPAALPPKAKAAKVTRS